MAFSNQELVMGPQEVMMSGAVAILVLSAALWHARLHLAQVRESLAKAELKLAGLEGQQSHSEVGNGRMSAIELELDAVHQQIARLAEGQDLLTRVLTEQDTMRIRLLDRAPREQITPH
jgi:hypothetical protein